MTGFDLDGFLPYRLAVAAQRVSADFRAVYGPRHGLSVAEWRVMAHLSSAGPVSVREIFERVAMDKPKVSRAASRLELAGLIEKRPDPRDRRLVALSLTERGRAVMADLVPLARAFEARAAGTADGGGSGWRSARSWRSSCARGAGEGGRGCGLRRSMTTGGRPRATVSGSR
jgi:DNA-binding MarR family transcriptional regulator